MIKFLKRYKWRVQDLKGFQAKTRHWFSNRVRVNEIRAAIKRFYKRCSAALQWLVRRALDASRLAKGVTVATLISMLTVLFKWESGQSIILLLFDNSESIAIVTAAIVYLLEVPERRRQDRSEAWRAISLAKGAVGNRDRIDALERLNKDGVSLERIDLSEADLSGTDMTSANMESATLERAILNNANFTRANLRYANLNGVKASQAIFDDAHLLLAVLQNAQLFQAQFEGANLGGARLERIQGEMARFVRANLRGANLAEANLKNAFLWSSSLSEANLQQANLSWSHLQNADLRDANLQEANLNRADLRNADLRGAKLAGADLLWAENVTQTQLEQAKLCLTRLPEGIDLDFRRDCQEMGIHPETGEFLKRTAEE